MAEFEVNGVKFRSRKLNALDQFHVFRKLAPLFAAVGSLAQALQVVDDKGTGMLSVSMDSARPLIAAISSLPEKDCNEVLDKCLSVVDRDVGQAYAPIWVPEAKRMMFDDLDDAVVMIQIAIEVIRNNLGNFSNAQSSLLSR